MPGVKRYLNVILERSEESQGGVASVEPPVTSYHYPETHRGVYTEHCECAQGDIEQLTFNTKPHAKGKEEVS